MKLYEIGHYHGVGSLSDVAHGLCQVFHLQTVRCQTLHWHADYTLSDIMLAHGILSDVALAYCILSNVAPVDCTMSNVALADCTMSDIVVYHVRCCASWLYHVRCCAGWLYHARCCAGRLYHVRHCTMSNVVPVASNNCSMSDAVIQDCILIDWLTENILPDVRAFLNALQNKWTAKRNKRTVCHVQPTKTQISLRIRAVWSDHYENMPI